MPRRTNHFMDDARIRSSGTTPPLYGSSALLPMINRRGWLKLETAGFKGMNREPTSRRQWRSRRIRSCFEPASIAASAGAWLALRLCCWRCADCASAWPPHTSWRPVPASESRGFRWTGARSMSCTRSRIWRSTQRSARAARRGACCHARVLPQKGSDLLAPVGIDREHPRCDHSASLLDPGAVASSTACSLSIPSALSKCSGFGAAGLPFPLSWGEWIDLVSHNVHLAPAFD